MKELSITDSKHVSGGIGFTLVLSMLAGASGFSREKTLVYDAAWWGAVGFIAGIPMYGVGAFVTGPLGVVGGLVEGYVGHAIGSFIAHL